jgi:DNA topoisomerase-1
MKTLVISEKDIAAKKIVAHLSGNDFDAEKVGGVNVYSFTEGKGKTKKETIVVGLRGHIVSLDYPKEHQRWSLQKLPDLIWAEPQKKVDKDAKAIGDAIKKLAKGASVVVLATDYDREGELIGVEALDLVKEINPEVQVKRARFSALTKEEVTRAFENLVEVDHNLAASANARQVVDLAWGAALTRFLSIAAGQRGKDFLSVGRVQSPTLALIVDREKEIRAFVPTPYWEVHATVHKDGTFDVAYEQGRFLEEARAKAVHDKVKGAKTGRVTRVEKSKRTMQAPTPFDTTDYQRAAAALGYSIKRADSIAESLYTAGYVSYPRTANKVYPASLNLKEIVDNLAAKGSPFEKDAKPVQARWPVTPTRGKKETTDHPPIHPTGVVPKATDLDGPQWRVYELIVRRFLATLSDPAQVERLKVSIEIAAEPFTANGQRLVVPGFMAVYPYSTSKDVILPPLAEGDEVKVKGAELLAKETQPPGRLTQARLVQEMENLNLGTKATRGDIIQKLYDRDFVRNKTPEPTETGFAMIDALEKYATLIAKPQMTSALEAEMDRIAEGELKLDDVVEDSRKMLERVVTELNKNKDLIGGEIRRALDSKNTVGTCAESGHPLIVRKSKVGKRFVGCSGYPDCKVTFPLFQYGKVVPDNSVCPVCSAPVVQYHNQGSKRGPLRKCLTMNCTGVEEQDMKMREERKAAKLAREVVEPEPADEGEGVPPPGEPDPEDLGLEEEA